MKRTILICLIGLSFLGSASAQQRATVSGAVTAPGGLPDDARIGVHVVDTRGVWGREIGGARPKNGKFEVELTGSNRRPDPVPVVATWCCPDCKTTIVWAKTSTLPALRLTCTSTKTGNGTFDRETDTPYLGLAGISKPSGFFVPLYVDADTTLEAGGQTFALKTGWNIFTVRFPEGGEPEYDHLEHARRRTTRRFSRRAVKRRRL